MRAALPGRARRHGRRTAWSARTPRRTGSTTSPRPSGRVDDRRRLLARTARAGGSPRARPASGCCTVRSARSRSRRAACANATPATRRSRASAWPSWTPPRRAWRCTSRRGWRSETSASLTLYTVVAPRAEFSPIAGRDAEESLMVAVRESVREARRPGARLTADASRPPRSCSKATWSKQLAALDEHEFDLLVCGSRGYGPMRRVLLGGVSRKLIRRAACPVVVVPRAGRLAAAARDASLHCEHWHEPPPGRLAATLELDLGAVGREARRRPRRPAGRRRPRSR